MCYYLKLTNKKSALILQISREFLFYFARAYYVLTGAKHTHCFQSNLLLNIDFEEKSGAGDEIRTHDPHLGKVMLYH